VKPGREADRVLLAHMRDCLDRIHQYTSAERAGSTPRVWCKTP